jgi:uncharacterized protein
MSRVVHFEIHAADPERAATFYRDVFGWEVREWTIPGVEVAPEHRYWLATTGPDGAPGINGGIIVRRGPPPQPGQAVNAYVCTLDVTSLDESLERAIAAGATLAVPRMPIRGVGWLAYCSDPVGNIFGMMQNDPSAA